MAKSEYLPKVSKKPRKPGSGGRRPGSGRPSNPVKDQRKRYLDAWFEEVTLPEHREIIRKIVDAAKAGDRAAQMIYLDRIHGKPPQTLQHEGGEENRPIHVHHSPRGG